MALMMNTANKGEGDKTIWQSTYISQLAYVSQRRAMKRQLGLIQANAHRHGNQGFWFDLLIYLFCKIMKKLSVHWMWACTLLLLFHDGVKRMCLEETQCNAIMTVIKFSFGGETYQDVIGQGESIFLFELEECNHQNSIVHLGHW